MTELAYNLLAKFYFIITGEQLKILGLEEHLE
jgi:hypothetical protein